MDARQVLILITGQNKAYALRMAVEEGISHMWTVSALQQHPKVIITLNGYGISKKNLIAL